MVVGFYQLQFALFLCEELLDVLRGLVSMMLSLTLSPFAVSLSNFFLYASKMVTSSSPEIGMAKIAFAS